MLNNKMICLALCLCLSPLYGQNKQAAEGIIPLSRIEEYVTRFNGADNELYVQLIPNSEAVEFLSENIPRFECPDKELEEIYYFRWWTFRKHVKQTPDGYIITEFLPAVPWAGKYNGIALPAVHHFNEGRWLHNRTYLDSYAYYWLRGGGSLRTYSFPVAYSLYSYSLVTGKDFAEEYLSELIANYEAWEKEYRDPNGLYWLSDGRDGGECSAPTAILKTDIQYRLNINSYMFADALAISKIAEHAGKPEIAGRFRRKAEELRNLIHSKLWDAEAQFYKVAPRVENAGDTLSLVGVREQYGYMPWYFEELNPPQEYTVAWEQLTSPEGFYAPYGPTTSEQRHPTFGISYEGHECQFNGPSWPVVTSYTLTALSNLINRESMENKDVSKHRDAWLKTFAGYVKSHWLKREDGKVVPWIDENLNPFTGDWIARTRLKTWENGTWSKAKGGEERGKDYNHSTFCDLVINGLVGVRPSEGNQLTVNPLIPANTWDYFCLEDVMYKGHKLTILYDKSGKKYKRGKGLRVFVDGVLKGKSDKIGRLSIDLGVTR